MAIEFPFHVLPTVLPVGFTEVSVLQFTNNPENIVKAIVACKLWKMATDIHRTPQRKDPSFFVCFTTPDIQPIQLAHHWIPVWALHLWSTTSWRFP